jgi:hypothetical protein
MNKESDFQHSFLQAKSYSSKTVGELIQGEFDFALFSLSWDNRCISITQANKLKATYSCLLIPELRDKAGIMNNHEPILREYSKKIGKNSVINGDTKDLISLWDQLSDKILKIYRKKEKPLKIFIDLSTCVRYLAIGLISNFIKTGIVNQVTLFYAEGEYPEEKNPEDIHELFTTGGWEVLPIPGLEGEWDPNKKRMYLTSVGFEGSKTLRLISREEPDEVSLLFPDPGVKKSYTKRTNERNQSLIDRFQIKDKNIIRSSASDAVKSWKELSKVSLEKPENNNIFYVCCGTKPQSLALAMRSIVLDYPAVLYIKPDRHKVLQVNPLGKYWRYDIKDMSSLEMLDNEK